MLLIFDIDGTLFKGHRATVPAVQEAFEKFHLIPPLKEEIVHSIGTSMFDYELWLAERCGDLDSDKVLEEANRLELHHVRETATLYDGALDIMQGFKDAGHFIATCTNAPRDYFDAVLDGHELRPFIDLPMCKGDGFGGKSAMVKRAMATCADRPAVVIGDRKDDVDAAHANGALAIGTAYGYGADGELEEADTIIHSLARLPIVLP